MAEGDIVTFDGKPFFIRETDKGIFYAVKGIERDADLEGSQRASNIYDDDLGELVVGIHMREVPNRNISILVRAPQMTFRLPYYVEELRKLASICDCDYVSVERFGRHLTRLLAIDGVTGLYEVRPRLFRKIVDH